MKKLALLAGIFSLVACSHGFVFDPSIEAVEAGDFTLPSSLCSAVPNGGMDVCHVSEGTAITSDWRLILPTGRGVSEGEVSVYYRDIEKTYAITGTTVTIPFRDFFGDHTWSGSRHDGELLALAFVRYKLPDGTIELLKFRGIAKIVVTKAGYDRMPIDSGFSNWTKNCKIQYSTSGRTAVQCK